MKTPAMTQGGRLIDATCRRSPDIAAETSSSCGIPRECVLVADDSEAGNATVPTFRPRPTHFLVPRRMARRAHGKRGHSAAGACRGTRSLKEQRGRCTSYL